MKKNLFTFLLALFPLFAFADAVEINGIYYNLVAKVKQAEVTSNPNKYTGIIKIPETINYDNVTYSVTSIGNSAFYSCRGLTSVTIPNSVTSIGIETFMWCSNLTSITIPNSVMSIGNGAFSKCSGLTSVTIPNSVTSIGGSAFYDCSKLTSVTIPNSVTSIGEYAFCRCTSLTSITIPNSVTNIDYATFSSCTSLTSIIIPNSVAGIGDYAFSSCTSLTSIIIPNSVAGIGDYAFSSCSSLTFITLPNSVIDIGKYAFYNCTGLTSITIGSGIKTIGYLAFAKCSDLTDMFCYAENVPNTNSEAFTDSYIEYATLHVPEESLNAYKEVEPWSGFKNIVKIMPMYTLTYMIDGGIYKSYQIEEGATITPETEPMKEGYTFSGWSEIPETMPDHDVTITGTFTVNKYKLTYKVDGAVYMEYDVEYGATITPEAEPTKEGYTFSGWSEIPTTMPAHDVTVTGTFTQETGIEQIMGSENGSAMIFTIDGKRVDDLKKGLNVIRMKDGTTRKVVVK